MTKRSLISLTVGLLCILSSCGGGGGSGSGMLIEGTLTEAGGAGHATVLLRHSAGQRIENVQICALGECSTTDSEGQWGFVAPEEFHGGEVLFSLNGHGISQAATVVIQPGAEEVIIDFQHVEGGLIEATHVTTDGVTNHDNHDH